MADVLRKTEEPPPDSVKQVPYRKRPSAPTLLSEAVKHETAPKEGGVVSPMIPAVDVRKDDDIIVAAKVALTKAKAPVIAAIGSVTEGSERDNLDTCLGHIQPFGYTSQVRWHGRRDGENADTPARRRDHRHMHRVKELRRGWRSNNISVSSVVSRLDYVGAPMRINRSMRFPSMPEHLKNVTWIGATPAEAPEAWEEARERANSKRKASYAERDKRGKARTHRQSHGMYDPVPRIDSLEQDFFRLERKLVDGEARIRAVPVKCRPGIIGYSSDPVQAHAEKTWRIHHDSKVTAWCRREGRLKRLGPEPRGGGNGKRAKRQFTKRHREWIRDHEQIVIDYHNDFDEIEAWTTAELDSGPPMLGNNEPEDMGELPWPEVPHGEEYMYDLPAANDTEATPLSDEEEDERHSSAVDHDERSPARVRYEVRQTSARLNNGGMHVLAIAEAEIKRKSEQPMAIYPKLPHEVDQPETSNVQAPEEKPYSRRHGGFYLQSTHDPVRQRQEEGRYRGWLIRNRPEKATPHVVDKESDDRVGTVPRVEIDLSTKDGRDKLATILPFMQRQVDVLKEKLFLAKVEHGEADSYVDRFLPDEKEDYDWTAHHFRDYPSERLDYNDVAHLYRHADAMDNRVMGQLMNERVQDFAGKVGFFSTSHFTNPHRDRQPQIIVEKVDVHTPETSAVHAEAMDSPSVDETPKRFSSPADRIAGSKRLAHALQRNHLRYVREQFEQKNSLGNQVKRFFNRLMGGDDIANTLSLWDGLPDEEFKSQAESLYQYTPCVSEQERDEFVLQTSMNPRVRRRLRHGFPVSGHEGSFNDMIAIAKRDRIPVHDGALGKYSYNKLKFPTRIQKRWPELFEPNGDRKPVESSYGLTNDPANSDALEAEIIVNAEQYKADLDKQDHEAESRENEVEIEITARMPDPVPVHQLSPMFADIHNRLAPDVVDRENRLIAAYRDSIVDLGKVLELK